MPDFSKIEELENPTRQFLPIMSTKCCSGDGEGRKDKGGGGGSRSKTKLCVTKLSVKDGVTKKDGEGGCRQVPRLPCKVPRRHRR